MPVTAFVRVGRCNEIFELLLAHKENAMISAAVTLTHPQGAGRQFVATSGTGHRLLIDDAAGNSGPKPVELVAIALAGCTAFDVINILRKKRQRVTAYEVKVEAEQAPTPPQVFTAVRIHHIVTGIEVSSRAVEDAMRLSEEKYCSVGAMVQKSAELHTSFEVIATTQPALARA
jgi:putative redox protein